MRTLEQLCVKHNVTAFSAFDCGKVKNRYLQSLMKVLQTHVNHSELEIHRSGPKMMKIRKDCISFNGAQLADATF